MFNTIITVYQKSLFRDMKKQFLSLWPCRIALAGAICLGGLSIAPVAYAAPNGDTAVTTEAQANQGKTIKGKVVDSKGAPLGGVRVRVAEMPSKGAITNAKGEFTISGVDENQHLIFTSVGYRNERLSVRGVQNVNVVLQEDVLTAEDVVVTAFATGQKKASLVGSVQTVRPAELKVPASNLSASFAGRLAGVVSVQRTGAPGADGADFWIRGISSVNASSPLIILDGVAVSAGDLNALDPEVIEGFSILKDATATALYGSRGANGVVIVTTKTGTDLPKPIINVRVEGYVNTPTRLPKFVDGPRFMELFNEALDNLPTGDVKYTREKIENTRAGVNPYVFPNVMWYDELFKTAAFNQKANFNIRGGGKKLDYFMSVTADHQTGMLKNRSLEHSSFDNSLNVYRYAFQNNIRVNFTETSSLALRLNAQIGQSRGPRTAINDIFGQVINSNPVDFPIAYPEDGETLYTKWGARKIGPSMIPNPYATAVAGYTDNFNSTVIANLEFTQDLKMITPGLKFTALASFKNWASTSTSRFRDNNYFELTGYQLNPKTGEYDFTLNRLADEVNTNLKSAGGNNGDRRFYAHAMLLWNRNFGGHDLGAMFNYNQEETANNLSNDNILHNLPRRKQGLAGRFTYSYDNRYVFEANFGFNGTENFAKGKRFGFFPSVALGYNVSEEKFWEPIKEYIPLFKLRGSYGLVGNEAIGGDRFVYLPDVNLQGGGPSYTTGLDQEYGLIGPNIRRFGNPDITWEVGKKANVGIDLQILKGLRLNVDLFHEYRTNVFQQRGAVPSYMGTAATKIYGNLAEISNRGIDAALDFNKNVSKDFWYNVRGTFTFARNRVEKWDEPFFLEYPLLSQVGRSLNVWTGYVAERLFIDDAEVANSPDQSSFANGAKAGDIKYKDLPDRDGNYNGRIDSNDRMPIGYPTIPEIIYGLGSNMKYKNVDFGIFFQGVANTSMMLSGFHPFGTQSNRNVLQFIADDHWSASNQNIHAAYPELTKQDKAVNTAASTYWLRDASFLKLKNIELGYTYKNARLYVSAQNVYTFSKFKHWDPEMGGGNGLKYPTQTTINVGLQVSFK